MKYDKQASDSAEVLVDFRSSRGLLLPQDILPATQTFLGLKTDDLVSIQESLHLLLFVLNTLNSEFSWRSPPHFLLKCYYSESSLLATH